MFRRHQKSVFFLLISIKGTKSYTFHACHLFDVFAKSPSIASCPRCMSIRPSNLLNSPNQETSESGERKNLRKKTMRLTTEHQQTMLEDVWTHGTFLSLKDEAIEETLLNNLAAEACNDVTNNSSICLYFVNTKTLCSERRTKRR
jgi:hypothetical protein